MLHKISYKSSLVIHLTATSIISTIQRDFNIMYKIVKNINSCKVNTLLFKTQ